MHSKGSIISASGVLVSSAALRLLQVTSLELASWSDTFSAFDRWI